MNHKWPDLDPGVFAFLSHIPEDYRKEIMNFPELWLTGSATGGDV